MGYRFGEHKYGEGRYSRWPDWWHDKACLDQNYTVVTCEQEPWAPLDSLTASWGKDETPQGAVWESGDVTTPPWVKGDQQAILAKQAVRWGRTR